MRGTVEAEKLRLAGVIRGDPSGVVLLVGECAVGIVVFDSDYAFTVTNVIIHGVPYFAIVYSWMRKRDGAGIYFARTGAPW